MANYHFSWSSAFAGTVAGFLAYYFVNNSSKRQNINELKRLKRKFKDLKRKLDDLS